MQLKGQRCGTITVVVVRRHRFNNVRFISKDLLNTRLKYINY